MARVVEEIDGVFGGGEPVTFQALRALTLTEQAVKEALRLHPPLFMLVRVAMADFVYKEWWIPKGTWVLISPTVSHQIPSLFADPSRFDPSRFAPPREEDKRDFAFIPFGGGRHKCLGNAFAILQVKTILAILLGRYSFDLAGDPIASDIHGLVVGPKEPCRVRYRRRTARSVPVGARPVAHVAQNGAGGCPFHAPTANGEAAAKAEATATKPLSVQLDRDLCQGHAACVGEAPEVFRIGADGKVELIQAHPDASLHARVRSAAQYCPTRTIRIVEG
jgi:sterol 14-demethylase